MGILGSSIAAFVYYSCSIFRSVIGKHIESHPDDQSLRHVREIHRKLLVANILLQAFMISCLPMCLVFVPWSFLRRKNAYLQLVIRLTMSFLEMAVIVVFINSKTASSSYSSQSKASSYSLVSPKPRSSKHQNNYSSAKVVVTPMNADKISSV